MSDNWVRLAVILLKPVEAFHAWRWHRAFQSGKYRRPL